MKRIYEQQKPTTAIEYRDRCMLGLMMFQGFLQKELAELRTCDIDLAKGTVFVQAQVKTNSRTLPLESIQIMHLYEYLTGIRKQLVAINGNETDKVFVTYGNGKKMQNACVRMLKRLKYDYPQVQDSIHLRSSIISHWQQTNGIIQAMQKAGMRYVSSLERFQTNKYVELQDQLRKIHPLDMLEA